MGIGGDFPVFRLNLKTAISPIGGYMVRMINRTGGASKKGTVVILDTSVEQAVQISPVDADEAIGIIYNGGIAEDKLVWIVIGGIADVLIQDGQIATIGYWVRSSITQGGRADITLNNPPGGGIPQADEHFKEIGHCQESKISGTDVLARCNIHFN